MNMDFWLKQLIQDRNKKAFPILSYPAVQLLFITVDELAHSAKQQALGVKLLADRYDMPIAGSYMDLSVEAEAFGAKCVFKEMEIPTIIGQLVETEEQADALRVPEIGEGRTGIVLDGLKKTMAIVKDRPVFANCVGPFSLAGRLMDVNEILLLTLEEPETVHKVLRKTTDFIISYMKAFKAIGCNGVIMAEPLAGLLSEGLMQEFSTEYVKEIVAAVQDSEFLIVYHNCANAIERKINAVIDTGCKMFHFGDNADMKALCEGMPSDVLIMGNISPSQIFKADSSDKMAKATQKLLMDCMTYDNFMMSSGCDIPADVPMENIDKYFEVVELGYKKMALWDMMGD